MGAAVKDRLLLLACAVLVSAAAWASWHWWSECFTYAFIGFVLLGLAVDNYRLRRQVASLLARSIR
jgi:membrane protease YdiL (CAAX protease family)